MLLRLWDSPDTALLEWLPRPPSGDLTDPGIKPASLMSPALAGGFFTTWAAREGVSSLTFPYLRAESAFLFFLKLWA